MMLLKIMETKIKTGKMMENNNKKGKIPICKNNEQLEFWITIMLATYTILPILMFVSTILSSTKTITLLEDFLI